MSGFERIGVVGNPEYAGVPEAIDQLVSAASKRGWRLLVERDLHERANRSVEELPRHAGELDLVVTLGGDGTLLRASRWAAPEGVPILGINLGRLGFLTTITQEQIGEAFERLAAGDYRLDDRMALEVRPVADGEELATYYALNEAVLHKSGFARLVMLRISVDGEEVGVYSADGVIVSTPTGSTAYSLSAGGPILDPRLDAIVATPICPHTLAVRPLVLPPGALIAIELLSPSEELKLTMDGQVGTALRPGHRVVARRAERPVQLVRWPEQSFFATLRRKLGWGDLQERLPRDPDEPRGSVV